MKINSILTSYWKGGEGVNQEEGAPTIESKVETLTEFLLHLGTTDKMRRTCLVVLKSHLRHDEKFNGHLNFNNPHYRRIYTRAGFDRPLQSLSLLLLLFIVLEVEWPRDLLRPKEQIL